MKKQTIAAMLLPIMALQLAGCVATESTQVTVEENTVQEEEKDEYALESGNIKLKVWGAAEDLALLESMCQSFAKEYASQATFEFELTAVSEADSVNVFLEDIDNAPDVFSYADEPRAFVAAGAISPVPNPEEIASANTEATVQAATVNEVMYGYPMTADNGYFLYYNSDYLSENDVKSLDRILEVAAENGKQMTYEITSGWYLYSFFAKTGLTVGMNDDGVSNYCTWNSVDNEIKGVDVAMSLQTLVNTPGFLCGGNEALLEGAANDTVIAGVSGMWNAVALEEIWGDSFAAAKLPTYTCAGKQIQLGSFTGYKLYGVNAYSEHLGWAHKLADWVTNEENQMRRLKERGLGPSNKNVLESDEVQKSVALRAFMEQAEYADIQKVSSTYWVATGKFGSKLANNNIASEELQSTMDELVLGIEAVNGQ